jgi:anaerobic magnesium-protoporphyrin IX monomethyl ester cyclase
MTDILFGQSYYLCFDPKLYEAMQPYPPLGTLYAASFMREQGYEVALFDAMLANGPGEWATMLKQVKPRFVVIYEDNFNYLSKMSLLRMREAAVQMVKAAKVGGCTVIVSGADMTDHPDVYLNAGADVVIIGEGESTLHELVANLSNSESISTMLPGSPCCVMGRFSRHCRARSSPTWTSYRSLPGIWSIWTVTAMCG